MLPNTRRVLYLGLGGVGIKSILKTKKLFLDEYGTVPPSVSFLGIDIEGRDLGMQEGSVLLSAEESCKLDLWTGDYYRSNRQAFGWMPPQNESEMVCPDIGQQISRMDGRLCFYYNFNRIQDAVRSACSRLFNSFQGMLGSGPHLEVNVVFSLAGGTGGGLFLDVAFLIRKLFGQVVFPFNGYAVLPRVFCEKEQSSQVRNRLFSNSYCAIQDLDFLMNLENDDTPVTFDWLSASYDELDFRRNPTPFDFVYLVDNVNDQWKSLDLETMMGEIAQALFFRADTLGDYIASRDDSLLVIASNGCMNVNDKRSWAARFGAASLVYHGERVSAQYARKVILRMIQRSLDTKEDGNLLATSWIDNLRIREDKGQDQVIDALCSETPELQLEVTDKKSPDAEIKRYCENVVRTSRESAEKVLGELLAHAQDNLDETVSNYLKSGDGCLTTTMDFLSNVKSQIDIFIGEMEAEKKVFEEKTASLEQKKAIAVKSLKEEANKPWVKRSSKRVQEYEEDSIRTTNEFVVNENEIIRRLYAVQFFNTVLDEQKKHTVVVEGICGHMGNLKIQLQKELNEMNASGRPTTMEIDLADSIVRSLDINDSTLLFSDFYPFVGEKGLEGVETTEEMEEIFFEFAESRPEYSSWQGKTVSQVLDSLYIDDYPMYWRTEEAIANAAPMLKIEDNRYHIWNDSTVREPVRHDCYICVEDRENNRLLSSERFKERLGFAYAIGVSTGLKDRITFYREEKLFPPALVGDIRWWERENQNSRISCHFDQNILDRMTKENYHLEPSPYNPEQESK